MEIKLYFQLGKGNLESHSSGEVTGEEIKDHFGLIQIAFKDKINSIEHDTFSNIWKPAIKF